MEIRIDVCLEYLIDFHLIGCHLSQRLEFFQNINYWLLTSFFKGNWHYKLFSTFCLNYTQVDGQFRGYQCGTSYNKNNWSLSLVDVSLLLTVFTYICHYVLTCIAGQMKVDKLDYSCNNCSTELQTIYTVWYVDNDHYCEFGFSIFQIYTFQYYDPLWYCFHLECPCGIYPDMT